MKTIKVYSDKDCVIRYAVWPEEPVLNMLDAFSNKRKEKWGDSLAHYSNALQKAKDESVPFEDQQLVLEVTNLRINKTYLPGWTTLPDCFYDIEFNGEIEVVEVPEYPIDHTSYPPYIKVARLLPSKEETREKSDNEVIAEFMGLPLTKQEPEFSGDRKMKTVPFMKWQYDKSWDWLMPVVEKINKLNMLEFNMDRNEQFLHEKVVTTRVTSELKYLYETVVEFIKWYNEHGNFYDNGNQSRRRIS